MVNNIASLSSSCVFSNVIQMADFEKIYQTHVQAVLRYTLRMVGNRELAEDITSEVFLELYRNLDAIDPERLPAWLFRVARNRAVDYWRKQSVEQRFARELQPPEAAPESGLEVEAWLIREPALKPVHRVCLILHFVHDMSRAEIGRRLELSEVKVKGHLQYALKLLRKACAAARKGGLHGLDEPRASGARAAE